MSQNLRGKVAIVTGTHDTLSIKYYLGSNAGIGLATASGLLKRGCQVIMACRSEQRATDAIDIIKKEYTSAISQDDMPSIEFIQLDLASLESTRKFVTTLEEKSLVADFLILNAGAFFKTHGVTPDGFEGKLNILSLKLWLEFFQINYLSHFLLTYLILEKNLLAEDGRILSLSSGAHKWAKPGAFVIDELKTDMKEKHGIWQLYGISKLCAILITKKLQKDFNEKGSKV
jgi:NAD(P)-dependent dehydrogenase (short-subunit alcohol dehydrogenase family)